MRRTRAAKKRVKEENRRKPLYVGFAADVLDLPDRCKLCPRPAGWNLAWSYERGAAEYDQEPERVRGLLPSEIDRLVRES